MCTCGYCLIFQSNDLSNLFLSSQSSAKITAMLERKYTTISAFLQNWARKNVWTSCCFRGWTSKPFQDSRPTPSCDQLHRWGHLGENHDRMRWDWLQPERLGKGVLCEEDHHFKFSLLIPHSASELNEKSEEVSSLWQPFPWIERLWIER